MANTSLQTITTALALPEAGQSVRLALPVGKEITLTFDPGNVLFGRSGEDLVIYTEGNGSGKLFLVGLFAPANAGKVPDFILPGGDRISGEDFLTAMTFDAQKFVTEGAPHATAPTFTDIFPEDGAVTLLQKPVGSGIALAELPDKSAFDVASAEDTLAALIRHGFM